MAATKPVNCLAALALAGMLMSSGPATAQQNEIDYLKQYAGDWQGTGTMTGGEEPEDFTCRLTIAGGSQAKINYTGRCSLLNLNLSVNGAIAYNVEARRYEAVMTSNAAFSGVAIGRRSGNTIVFDLRERNVDREGQELTIGSEIILSDDLVTVEFEVTFNESGDTMHSSVPFSRM